MAMSSATARQHLLANLDGCIAWRDPAQAEAQKERMRQKKEKERQQAEQLSEPPAREQEHETVEEEISPAFCMRM